jgi:hypothetical protein
MPKYCVEELEGALLDAAVAKAASLTPGFSWGPNAQDGSLREGVVVMDQAGGLWSPFQPSTEWADAGPIIERERIHLVAWPTAEWGASVDPRIGMTTNGKTPLIAAMRAYVASKFGREVELP